MEVEMEHLTRREFTGILLAGVGGIRSGLDDKLKPSVFGGIELGVQSYTFRAFNIDKMIDAMKSVGLSNVELWDGHLDPKKATEADFKATRKKFNDAGIRVSAYCVNFPEDSTDDYLDRGFNGALLLGTNVMTASVQKSITPRIDRWCQKYKIKLGLHNHWFGDAWFKGDRTKEFETPEDLMSAVKSASSYLNINLDIGHFSAAGFDPIAFIRQHHDRIVSLHIKDRDRDKERTYRRFGHGGTPIVETMKLLKQIKFKYTANIEYEMDESDPTDGVRDSLEYLKRTLA